jgi:OOP family OmpA-OmpF porin
LSIDAAANGTGKLHDLGGDTNLTIVIGSIGAAELHDLGGDRNLQITVAVDGSGHYKDLGGDRNLTFTREPDGAVRLIDRGGSANLEVKVASDGSGTYRDGSADVIFDFGSDGRATDGSGYVIRLPRAPVFSVPDRFPPLGRFGQLRPPCATVLRFAADVLFDFDKATLKPEATAMITRASGVLAKAGKPIQVEGHTDAKGSDAYNDDLSLRRAQAFATALKQHEVNATITAKGWGEKRPVAPNTAAGGKDNPSGRAQNRRVEVILKN